VPEPDVPVLEPVPEPDVPVRDPVPEPFDPVPEPGPLPVRFRVVESFIVPGPVPGVPVLGVVLAPVDGLVLLVPGVPAPAVPVPAAAAPALPVAVPFIELPLVEPPLIEPPLIAALVSVPAAPGVVDGATLPPLVPIVVSRFSLLLLQAATASTAASASMLLPVVSLRMHPPSSLPSK
jgi:hypothetical protein